MSPLQWSYFAMNIAFVIILLSLGVGMFLRAPRRQRCCCPQCTGNAKTCPHWAGTCRCITERAERLARDLLEKP